MWPKVLLTGTHCLRVVLIYQLSCLIHVITIIRFPKREPLCDFQQLLFFRLLSQNHLLPFSPVLGCGSFLPHDLHVSQLHSCNSLQMPLMVTCPSAHSHYPEIFSFKKPMSGICSFSDWNKNIPTPSPGARHNCFTVLRSKLSHLALHSFHGRKP